MRSFIDQKWLEENPLSIETVLGYFSQSPFYDRSSLNEILRMQSQYTNFFDFNKKMNEMNGIRYIIEEENDIFLIYKIDKNDDDEKLVDFHYVMHGIIYQENTINEIYEARLSNFLYFIN